MLPDPPWITHPTRHRWSSLWIENPERARWQAEIEALSRDQRIAYFRARAPIPTPWMDVVTCLVDGSWACEREDEIFAQMARVEAETGLVSLASYLEFLERGS